MKFEFNWPRSFGENFEYVEGLRDSNMSDIQFG